MRRLEQDFINQRAERSLSRGLLRWAGSEQRPGLPRRSNCSAERFLHNNRRRYAASVFLIAGQTVFAKWPWPVSVMAFSDRGL